MYYRIIPFEKSFDTFWLVYRAPKELEASVSSWNIVRVPIWNMSMIWLCAGEVNQEDISIEEQRVKDINELLSDFMFADPIRIELMSFISEHYITPIHAAAWVFFPKNLLEKTLKNKLESIKIKEYQYDKSDITLSKIQREVFTSISKSVSLVHLIYGVTGSGKTHIYMKLIEANLKIWKQTLLLIPEIILTSQIGERIAEIFWKDVLLIHSGVSAAKKSQYWMNIHSWNAKIIVGTRSALFYPYRNLWNIIIDEEHDMSYISDAAPRYSAVEVAIKLSQLSDCKIILWSGTPRVTSFHKALWWDYQLHQMLETYTD